MGILRRTLIAAALLVPAFLLHADAGSSAAPGSALRTQAQMASIDAYVADDSMQLPNHTELYLQKDLDRAPLDGTLLAVESPDQRSADQGDQSGDNGSGDVTPTNPHRQRVDQATSSDDEDNNPPPPRRKLRHYRHAERKVNSGAVILGSILTAVGVVCLIVSVWSYGAETGDASSTLSWNYGGGYVNASGTFTNTGTAGLTSSYVEVAAYNGNGTLNNYYDVSVDDSTPGDSQDWYLYNLYTNVYPGGGVYATPYYTAYNYWGVAQDVELIVGIACIAGGIVTIISGLTHTDDVMSENGVNVNVQASQDKQDLLLMASKSF